MSTPVSRRRWSHIYALLIGTLGLHVLVQLFVRQALPGGRPVDLPALLLFALIALIVSYFKIPVGSTHVELSLEGSILLGATLVGGPAVGGWTAFITGLVTSIGQTNLSSAKSTYSPLAKRSTLSSPGPHSAPSQHTEDDPPPPTESADTPCLAVQERPNTPREPQNVLWVDRAAAALSNSGSNVIAIAAAWLAYEGMGGTIAPIAVDSLLALALIVLCVVYALVRCLCFWPLRVLSSTAPRQALAGMVDLTTLLVELIPLPVAPLIAATFVELGWSSFLVLALVFVGLSAVMRQMIETMSAMREQIDVLTLANRVMRASIDAPQEVDALCKLAYQFCTEIVLAFRFELGLYETAPRFAERAFGDDPDDTQDSSIGPASPSAPASVTHVYIQVSVDETSSLPPMRVPITPPWQWLYECREPFLAETAAQLAMLPFTFPPIGVDGPKRSPQSAILVPLLGSSQPESRPESSGDLAEPGDDRKPAHPPSMNTTKSPVGAIIIQSPYPNAFSARDMTQIAVIAKQIGMALEKVRVTAV